MWPSEYRNSMTPRKTIRSVDAIEKVVKDNRISDLLYKRYLCAEKFSCGIQYFDTVALYSFALFLLRLYWNSKKGIA